MLRVPASRATGEAQGNKPIAHGKMSHLSHDHAFVISERVDLAVCKESHAALRATGQFLAALPSGLLGGSLKSIQI